MSFSLPSHITSGTMYLQVAESVNLDVNFNFTAEYRQDISGQNGKDTVNLTMSYTKKF